jgi:GGDEF domain-containing protein
MTSTTDITTLQAEIARLTVENTRLFALAFTDALTGIPNRLALMDADPATGVLALCDLNGFKAVNDTHGHDAGDRVLVDFAAFAANLPGVAAYRLGGDEFVIVTTDPTVLDAVRGWVHELGCTTSIGVADLTGGLSAALGAADRAMYADKVDRRANRR